MKLGNEKKGESLETRSYVGSEGKSWNMGYSCRKKIVK
jgi:hypothetical protein